MRCNHARRAKVFRILKIFIPKTKQTKVLYKYLGEIVFNYPDFVPIKPKAKSIALADIATRKYFYTQ
jgi:hypothetical protein